MALMVVGGMNLDLLAFPNAVYIPRDSNPGRIVMRPGGVGRNIASRLAALGQPVSLITALGNDEKAGMLRAACEAERIDLSFSVQTACPSPCYLCIHDEQGDMVAAVSDMAAVDEITPAALATRLPAINAADFCILDANLSAQALHAIAVQATVPLALDPVSCAKSARVLPILPFLTLIKPNLSEATAMTGETSPALAAKKLVSLGARYAFVSLGAKGVFYASASGDAGLVPASPLPSVPLTGAGDALLAGLTLAILQGKSAREAAVFGCQVSHDALLSALNKPF